MKTFVKRWELRKKSMTVNDNTPEQPSLFFWLGEEGLEEMEGEDFYKRVDDLADVQNAWKEVRFDDEDETEDSA